MASSGSIDGEDTHVSDESGEQIGLTVVKNVSDESEEQIGLTVVKKYKTDMEIVQFMAACSDESLWVSENVVENVLKKSKHTDDGWEIQSQFNIVVYGIAVTPSDDLLLSTDGPTLQIIRGNTGEMLDSQISVNPLEPKFLHISRSGEIFISVKSRGPLYPAKGQRLVIVTDMEGNQKAKYGDDETQKRLFTYPWGIATSKNGNICVIDRLSVSCEGRVVVLNSRGGVENIYNGYPEVEAYEFEPRGIVVTETGNILVSATALTVKLHILDSSGQPLAYFDTERRGIEMPFSLVFTTSGKFYIGGTTFTESTDTADLYEIILTGC